MDGNGNNNSKVSTLRQHFENYEKVERKGSVGSATIFPVISSSASSSAPPLKRRERGSGSGSELCSEPPPKANINRSVVDSVDEKDLMSVVSGAEAERRRNGIYVGNSLYEDSSTGMSGSKRRGVLLNDFNHHQLAEEVGDDDEDYVDVDEDELDDEHDDPTLETSIPIAFERHQDELHDGISLRSNSTTSSHHSFHGQGSYVKSQGGKNEKGLATAILNGTECKANTPTSSSSCSSGSGGCGKVKRRNAFRHKDCTSFPTSVSAGDSSSAILKAVAKTKVAVERVKSLDSANPSGGGLHPNSITINSPPLKNNSGSPLNSGRSRTSESPAASKMEKEIGRSLIGERSSESKKETKGAHEPPNGKGTAQRATSLRVRTQTNSSPTLQQYEPSAFARNNNHPLHLQYNQVNFQNNHSNNHPLQSPDNHSINNSNSQRVVNIVTPYQVTDIYNQLKLKSDPAYPVLNANKKKHKQIMNEVEYAVPIHPKHKEKSQPLQVPPKVPPPPLNYPPSSVRKDQFGLPSPNSSYTFLPQRKSQGMSSSFLPQPKSAQKKKEKEAYGPPEKPPRTFLYNQAQIPSRGSALPSSSQAKRQHSSSSSSSTLTSGTATVQYQASPSFPEKYKSPPPTVRQANTVSLNQPSKAEPIYSRKNEASTKGAERLSNLSPKRSQPNHHHHQHIHPPLVRSKTESQLIVKNKTPRFNRPSDVGVYYGTDVQLNPHFHQDLLVDATNPTISGLAYYRSSSPPVHHKSQTNLLSGQGSKIYEREQFRSINNLKYSGEGIYSKYQSNPGLHYASRELSFLDNGLPPVTVASAGTGSSYNLYGDNQARHLMYATNIDISPRQYPSVYGVKPSDNSVQQLNNHFNLHHQYRPERSKSEWALNAVQNRSFGRGGGSNASDQARQINNQQRTNHALPEKDNSLPQMIRRATVAIGSGSNNSGSDKNPAGHPSLEQVSSANHSNSSLNVKGHGRHHVPNSIQHLVNQLFSTTSIKDATSSTDSGIQLGSESLSSCETPIGDSSTTDTGDSDCENDGDTSNSARKVVEARKGYVRRVSSVRVQELGESLHRLIQSSKVASDPLFECLLVVGLDRDPSNGIYHPYIREKFPRDVKLAEGVQQFCFPDSLEWPCHEGSTAQFYTLAITDQRGGRKFGCCFRILPEGANFCIPITYCIISSHRAIGFYREVLREITSCHGHSEYQRRHFLQELYKKSFPPPGSSISVTEPTLEETYVQNERNGSLTGSPPKTVTLRRRADHRLDEGDLVTLVSTVDLSIVIKLFGSLLLERKVVLLSRALSTLSLCIEALESLLYPFNWQHTFVPILPLDMTDVIDAPAPFLIGVLRSSRTAWDKTLDDGIVVDLDVENGKIISCVGDEGTILPKRINRKLRNALSQLVIDLADQKESTKNVLISECFIRMFVETLGHYANHIGTKADGSRSFERESFVKSSESKATQNFLEWFSETSMFNEFIELKLKSPNQHGLFEQRVMEQLESGPIVQGGSGTPKKDIWVKMKHPFGTWLKETFKQ